MKIPLNSPSILLITLCSSVFLVHAGNNGFDPKIDKTPSILPASNSQVSTNPPSNEPKLYIPSPSSKPVPTSMRSGEGATRSDGKRPATRLILLTPNHVGHTADAQPTFYWYVSSLSESKVMFTLQEKEATEPELERKVDIASPGFQSFSLANDPDNVELRRGKVYEWSISTISKENNDIPSSQDTIARAFIKRVGPNTVSPNELNQPDPISRARALGKQGLWYEFLAALMIRVDDTEKSRNLKAIRQAAFEEIGLVLY